MSNKIAKNIYLAELEKFELKQSQNSLVLDF